MVMATFRVKLVRRCNKSLETLRYSETVFLYVYGVRGKKPYLAASKLAETLLAAEGRHGFRAVECNCVG